MLELNHLISLLDAEAEKAKDSSMFVPERKHRVISQVSSSLTPPLNAPTWAVATMESSTGKTTPSRTFFILHY